MAREPRRLTAETVTLPQALTQAVLDRERCETPGCACDDSTIYLYAACHPRAGLEAAYAKATGRLTMRCKACKSHIATVAVAAR